MSKLLFACGIIIAIIGGCVALEHIRVSSDPSAFLRHWSSVLDTSELDLANYLLAAKGSDTRVSTLQEARHNIALQKAATELAGKTPSWYAMHAGTIHEKQVLDDFVSRFGRDAHAHQSARQSLRRLGIALKSARDEYARDDKARISRNMYAGLLTKIGGADYRVLDNLDLSISSTDGPFMVKSDSQIWNYTLRLLNDFRLEAETQENLRNAFQGIPANQPYAIAAGIKSNHEIVHRLLARSPTHEALGELFRVIEREIAPLAQ